MAEHSRAPWSVHISDSPVSLTGRIEVTTDAGIVCLVHPWEDPTDLADAILIAAAPDLLDALKYLVGECCEDMDDDYNPHGAPITKASEAIAKAEGHPSRLQWATAMTERACSRDIFEDRKERLAAAIVATCNLDHQGCMYPRCTCLITPNLVRTAIMTWERFDSHGESENKENGT